MASNTRSIVLTIPPRGVDESERAAGEPGETTVDAMNVVGVLPASRGRRGGSRQGLVATGATATGGATMVVATSPSGGVWADRLGIVDEAGLTIL